jgi:YtxH-like protein
MGSQMKLNGLLKSLLKTAVYIMDQTADQMDRASDRASHIASQAKSAVDDATSAIYPQEDHTLRNLISFAAGVGIGVGAGMLFAPSSGAELRSSIGDRVQGMSDRVKRRVSSQAYAVGNE